MKKKIKVTVGVCAKNAEVFIKNTIDSIINQDFPHEYMEVIFASSEDRTMSIIRKSVPGMDMSIEVFSQGSNGIGKARNIVLNNARGDFILWVDDDVTLQKDYVRKQVNFLEREPKVAMVGPKCVIYLEGNMISALENMIFRASYFARTHAKEATSALPGTGGSICRVRALRQVGGFDENLKKAGEDKDIAFRMQAAGWLLLRGQTILHQKDYVRTWKRLWDKHFTHGYASHFVRHKNEGIFALYSKIPPAFFITGLSLFSIAYKLTGRKLALLLPLFLFFTSTAFTLGYFKGHIDGYGHSQPHICYDAVKIR